jgi:hypothetical protein
MHASHVCRSLRAALLALLVPMLAACATTRDFSSVSALAKSGPTPGATAAAPLAVVLMPLDVELSVLTAGGVLQPNAAWTEAAKSHLLGALRTAPALQGKRVQPYVEPAAGDPIGATIDEIMHLHRAVGSAIMMHELNVPLPTKQNRFDWSLGTDTGVLGAHAGADYALFIYLRDSYSSTGRILTQLAAAALGVLVEGGQQIGFASLVNLRSGDVAWFNFLASPTGDLRDAAGATGTVENLLSGMPR